MYFVRSGVIHTYYGSLLYAGYANHSWSSTPHPADNRYAFYLLFDPTTAESSTNNNRYYAFPLSHEGFSMYFVRSGYIYLPNGSLCAAGYNSDLWSSSAHPASSQFAFYLDLNPANTAPSGNNTRYTSFTLRTLHLHSSSMYFVRNGNIHLIHAALDLAGTNSYSWSSTAYPARDQHTFSFHFDATTIVPSNLNSRWLGLSLRKPSLHISP